MSKTNTPDLVRLAAVRQAAKTGLARRVRELAEVTQTEVADSIGVGQLTVLRWESGDRCPRSPGALRYAAALAALAAVADDGTDPEIAELRRMLSGLAPEDAEGAESRPRLLAERAVVAAHATG